MKSEIKKIIAKKIIENTVILLVILCIIIAVTGVPIEFDVISYNGEVTPNMEIKEIFASIKDNFKMFLSGKAFNIKIQGETVGQLLGKTLMKSSVILFGGTVLAIVIGILKGIIDSRKNNKSGTFKLLQSLIPLSVPDILTIVLVQIGARYLFYNEISIFGVGPLPATGDRTLLHAIYPMISIAILPAAYISRITANIIEENFTKTYILAARGKGCSRFQIIKNHMMKSVFYGVLSGFPTVIGIMFSSLIIVETLYGFQGIGFYLIYFYTPTYLFSAYEAGVAFTTFIVVLAFFYYINSIVLNVIKDILLPQTKSH